MTTVAIWVLCMGTAVLVGLIGFVVLMKTDMGIDRRLSTAPNHLEKPIVGFPHHGRDVLRKLGG